MAYVLSNIACKRREDIECAAFMGMWLEISAMNDKFFVIVLYKTESNTTIDFWQDFQGNVDNIRSLYNPKIMILGELISDLSTRYGKLLKEFVDSNIFTMHILEPTCITESTAATLNQILTNFPQLVTNVSIIMFTH